MDPPFLEFPPSAMPVDHSGYSESWPIHIFNAASRKSEPWNALLQAPSPNDQHGRYVSSGQFAHEQSFRDYRSAASPSVCSSHLPPDSGYGGSRATYSIASASIHGDDTTLDLNIGQAMGDCRLNPAQDVLAARVTSRGPSGKFACTECPATVKSQGELKKHMQRHLKAHKCPYINCPKGQRGFSTSNDLVRHKRSVHGEHALPGRSFVCPHCTPGSKGPKVWPRADNFRSHLHRAHKITLTADDDHKDFIYRPPEDKINLKGVGSFHVAVDARPPYLQDSPGLSGQATSLDHHFGDGQLNSLQETSVGIDPSIFRSPSLVKPTAASNGDDEDELVEPMNMGSLDTQSIGDYDLQTSPDFDVESPEYDQQACTDHAAGTPAPTLPEPSEKPSPQPERHELSIDRLGPSECTQPGLEDHRADLALPQRCRRGPDFSAIVELLKAMAHGAGRNKEEIVSLLTAVPTEDLQTALRARGQDTGDACQSEDDPSNRPECNDCGKTFSRQCELKKHIKRHQKPYGCTFKQCSKRFGSKNDWKRHESSQHYELETWNCNKLNCNKTCQRRESFKNHLQKDHDVKGAEEIEEMLEKCRMGRHCGPRFWCGFCVEIIEISAIERGGNSWTKRCDHIDNHLFGKEGLEKKDISEWRYQEDEQDAIKEVDFLAVPGSDVDMAGGKKRKSTEDIDVRPFKKPSGDETYMWNCCFCDTTMNFKTSPSCVECGHVRCSTNCMVERVETSDDQMAAMEGEEAAVAGDDMPRP